MRAEGDGTSARSSPVRKADIFIGILRANRCEKRIDGSGTWRGLSVTARISVDPAPGKAQKNPGTKGGSEGMASAPPQSEAFDTSDLRKFIDEVEKQQSRRRVEANETVDLRVNTAKAHVEQEETLLRQTSSNLCFLFCQDVLALKDAKGNKMYSDYGDARARIVSWGSMPVRLRALLGDIGPAKWL